MGVREQVIETVTYHFKEIPKNLREEIIRRRLNDGNPLVREKTHKIISRYFNDLPDDLKR